eukprot:747015-Pelagomonas_calceolata.AAC.6
MRASLTVVGSISVLGMCHALKAVESGSTAVSRRYSCSSSAQALQAASTRESCSFMPNKQAVSSCTAQASKCTTLSLRVDATIAMQLVNSVYLDNSSCELYHGRLDKKPGAIALRIR